MIKIPPIGYEEQIVVKHIVFFKLKDKSFSKEVQEKLLSLKENVKVVKSLEVGENFADSPRAYDISLTVELESKDDLKTYAVDPYHEEIKKYLKTTTIDSKVVDYIN